MNIVKQNAENVFEVTYEMFYIIEYVLYTIDFEIQNKLKTNMDLKVKFAFKNWIFDFPKMY